MSKDIIHLGIKIEKPVVDQLQRIARAEERSMSALVRRILKSWLTLNAGKIKT